MNKTNLFLGLGLMSESIQAGGLISSCCTFLPTRFFLPSAGQGLKDVYKTLLGALLWLIGFEPSKEGPKHVQTGVTQVQLSGISKEKVRPRRTALGHFNFLIRTYALQGKSNRGH